MPKARPAAPAAPPQYEHRVTGRPPAGRLVTGKGIDTGELWRRNRVVHFHGRQSRERVTGGAAFELERRGIARDRYLGRRAGQRSDHRKSVWDGIVIHSEVGCRPRSRGAAAATI